MPRSRRSSFRKSSVQKSSVPVESKKVVSAPLRGIGGWLLLFVILESIMVLFNLFGTLGDPFYFYYALFGLIGVFYLTLLFLKSPWAPRMTIIGLWLGFLIGSALVLYDLVAGPFYPAERYIGSPGADLVVGLIAVLIVLAYVLLWSMYFMKSNRVKNTFK